MKVVCFLPVLLMTLTLGAGCSVRRFAINKIGDAIASGGTVYQSDNDMELVGDALPFGLKLTESLLAETPRHKGLLTAACEGFTSYSYIYVHQEADRTAVYDLSAASHLRRRARRLYQRAHGYCLRGLEASYSGITDDLWKSPTSAAAILKKKDVPLIYWTAASLGLTISLARTDASMLARLPETDALLARALELDENWGNGALHEFSVSLSGAIPGSSDYGLVRDHFERALELSEGEHAGLFVAYAEAFAIPQQKRDAFKRLLERALAVNPDSTPEVRLANLAAQQRARWLLDRTDDLILNADNTVKEKQP